MEDMHIHVRSAVDDYSNLKLYINRCIELGLNKVLLLDHGPRLSKNHFAKLKNELLHAKISPEGPERSAEGLREEKNGFGEGGEAVCLEKTVYLPPNPPCRKPRRAGTGDFVQK